MNFKFLIVIVALIFTTSSAWAEVKNKHKTKTKPASTSSPKISADQFGFLAYWTTLGLYEQDLDNSSELARVKSKGFVINCALNLRILMFHKDEKSIDVQTYLKRGMEQLGSSALGDQVDMVNCNPPTKQLMMKLMSDPRPFTELDDIRADSASFHGHEIMVLGKGVYIMNHFMLRNDMKDMNPVLVNIEKIDVYSKKWILQKCGDMMAPCDVMVNGTVDPGSSHEIMAFMIYPNESP